MKTKKISELPHFGRNGITIFCGGVGTGKSNAIVQTVSMTPEVVAIFLNAKLFSEYIRNDDVTIDVDNSMDEEALVSSLSVPMATKGSSIFMNITESNDRVQYIIAEIMKQHPNIEYVLVFNQNDQDDSSLTEYITGFDNSRIFFETQYIHEVDQEILCNTDVVLFWTPTSIIKYSNSSYSIERTRATLKCGEALYVSEGHEVCKICFDRYEAVLSTL